MAIPHVFENQEKSCEYKFPTFFQVCEINIKTNSRTFSSAVEFAEFLSRVSLRFISLLDCPMRFMRNHTPSLLDHIYRNQHSKKIHSGIIALPVSDYHHTNGLIENGFRKCKSPPYAKVIAIFFN